VGSTPDYLITLPKVCERVALSGSEIYRRIQTGEFPSPVPIGKSRVAWSAQEIDAHVEQCKRNRDVGREARKERAQKAIAARHDGERKRDARKKRG